MKYIANAWLWNPKEEPKLVKSFNSEDYPLKTSANAYDDCRAFVLEQLDTYDYGKMTFVDDGELAPKEEFFLGAFTHPVRGRVKFMGGLSAAELRKTKEEYLARANEKVFTANELYALKPVEVDKSLWWLLDNFGFVEGYVPSLEHSAITKIENEGRIELRFLANVDLGSDENWQLATVWFDGRPVMVVNHSGEDYDYIKYISDVPVFMEMTSWLSTFSKADMANGMIDPNKPLEQLTEFYGRSLHDYYDIQTQKPKPEHGFHHYATVKTTA